MAKAIVIYYSRGGNTKKMAQVIADSIKKTGLEVKLADVSDTQPEDLLEYDAIVVGSPTYYGSMAAEIKKLFDLSVKFHGRLEGKIGAAFSSSANIGGGNETTVLDILNAMLIHGMIIQGDSKGDHYGAISINEPDLRSIKECERFGLRLAALTNKLFK